MPAVRVLLLLVFALSARKDGSGAVANGHGAHVLSDLTCAPLPSVTEVPELFLLGQGQCVNAQGLTPQAFVCNASAAPPNACAAANANATACAAQCSSDDGCTGFELRSDPASSAALCFAFFATAPRSLPWVVGDAGTQLGNSSSRRTVVATDGSPSACCYRRSYPRPCPLDMPILTPPQQSGRAKEIFATMADRAAAASAAVLPDLLAFIDYCAANATTASGALEDLFGRQNCPGLADLTANGTLAPWPTSAQIVQRYSDEMLAMEVGHGPSTLWGDWGCGAPGCIADRTWVLNPLLPVMPNLYHPMTLGWNATPANNAGAYSHIMHDVFGCDTFRSGKSATLNFSEAAERILYAASNHVRGPVGNIVGAVGFFDAVLRPSYVRPMVLITPTDSAHCTLLVERREWGGMRWMLDSTALLQARRPLPAPWWVSPLSAFLPSFPPLARFGDVAAVAVGRLAAPPAADPARAPPPAVLHRNQPAVRTVRTFIYLSTTCTSTDEPQYPNCTGWPNCTVGTIDHSLHILYAYMTGGGPQGFPPAPSNVTCATQTQMLRDIVCNFFPNWDRQAGVANIPWGYYEMDPLGMIRYPEVGCRGQRTVLQRR
jgi:hypothetical protein